MKVSCLKRRVLVALVFLLTVAASGCGAFLITNAMMLRPITEAVQLIKAGNTEESLRQFEAKAQQYEVEKNWWNAKSAYRVAGLLAESLGNYQKAIIYLRKDVEITKKYLGRGREPRARDSLYLLARAYLAVNDHERALPLVQEALFKFIPDISNKNRAQLYSDLQAVLGDIYRMTGDLKSALQHHEEAVRVQEIIASQALRRKVMQRATVRPGLPAIQDRYLRFLTALARDNLALGEYQAATKDAENVLQNAKEFGSRDWEGEARRLLGDIAYKKDDKVAALSNYQQALALGEKLSLPGVSLWSHVGEARVYLAQGRADQAAEHLERAMKIVEALRSFLQLEQLRSSFFEDKAQVYSDAVLAQLQLGREEQAFHTMERSRSRAFLDLLGTRVDLSRSRELIAAEMELRRRAAELRLSEASVEEEDGEIESQPREKTAIAGKAYNDFLAKVRKESKEQASLLTVEPLGLKQAQALLDPGQVLLEYFVTSEKILLWVVGRDKVATLTLQTNRKDLIAKVNALRKQVSELTSLGEYQNAAQELYGLLIQPALPYIAGNEIIIVPHDALHYLPFQALYSPQRKYLIEEYSLSYLSSASLMQFTQEKRKAKGDLTSVIAQGGKLLTFGNPDLGDPKMSLQFAGIEAKEIKNLYPQSSIYLEKEATEEKAKTLSPQNDIVHFASHSELNENDPLSSAVLLAKSDKEDGRLEVREIFGMDLKASLVVLSACETGLGKLSNGDELVGLTRAFIYAGTPSVVASLWNVEDSSTAQLMATFYKNLKTMSKVDALRQAQLQLIQGKTNSDLLARRGIGGVGKLGETPSSVLPAPSSEPHAPNSVSTSHPYFWAPFILVGDGK